MLWAPLPEQLHAQSQVGVPVDQVAEMRVGPRSAEGEGGAGVRRGLQVAGVHRFVAGPAPRWSWWWGSGGVAAVVVVTAGRCAPRHRCSSLPLASPRRRRDGGHRSPWSRPHRGPEAARWAWCSAAGRSRPARGAGPGSERVVSCCRWQPPVPSGPAETARTTHQVGRPRAGMLRGGTDGALFMIRDDHRQADDMPARW